MLREDSTVTAAVAEEAKEDSTATELRGKFL